MAKKTPTKRAPAKRKTTPNKARLKKRTIFAFLTKWAFVCAIWGGIALTFILAWYGTELPRITSEANFSRKATITVLAADGQTIGRYGDLKGNTVTIADLPAHLPQAVIAIEDRRFYQHFGIDSLGITRALVNNITGGSKQGGSTITQQLAKNLFLSHERTLKRKIQEAMLALWLERELTKDEILSAYLNRVYLGSGTYGVDAAARLYFGKTAGTVNLQEAATLAGLLKAPSRYSPLNDAARSRRRAQTVLNAMVQTGFITQNQSENAGDITITQSLIQPLERNRARYFSDWVISGLDDIIGTIDEDITVETTLDFDMQIRAEDTLVKTIDEYKDAKALTQGAILVMHPSGAVLTMVGGHDYSSSQFNRATQAKRQPGSAFKPIIYLTALENGRAPDNLILDAPFEDTDQYRPRNFDNTYAGEVTLTDALTYSRNTPSVRLMKEVGARKTLDTARRLGIISKLEPDLSLALGSSAVSLTEITTAYATLANNGIATFPYAITKISSKDGELYYSRNPNTQARRIVEAKDAKALTKMLQNVVAEGTGRGAALKGTRAAGKTGTSQNSRDAWFVGYTDSLVAGVWLGNDNNTPMNGVTGGSLPARIWRQTLQADVNSYQPTYKQSSDQDGFSNFLSKFLSGNKTDKPKHQHQGTYND